MTGGSGHVGEPAPALPSAQAFLPEPSRLQRVLYTVSQGTAISTGVADLATTHRGEELGFEEGNPLLRKKNGKLSYPRKIALAVGVPVGAHVFLWRRGHYWKAIVANVGISLVQGIAAAHNRRLILLTEQGVPVPARGMGVRLRF